MVPEGSAERSSRGVDRPVVCYVTDRKAFAGTDPIERVLDRVRAAVTAGVDWIQIREKDLTGRELLEFARKVVEAASDPGPSAKVRVVMNERLDVALASRARGLHLGGGAAPATEVVRWCRRGNAPADFLVGVSCHSIGEARAAESAGASYLFFGPIFDTPSKQSWGPPQGIRLLAEVCRTTRIPVVAIGGVDERNAPECIGARAAGIAAIRLFQERRDANSLNDAVARLHNLASPIATTR
jgi:thiamine-phosphate pyrophosphorylase